jgi:membrane fusion protein (multidrug efflux system)
LLPGMFGRAAVDSGEKKTYLTLPQTAITYNPYGATVFITVDKKDAKGNPQLQAQQVFITPGPTRGDQVAILKGVSEGATVVTSGQLKLKNGTPLRIDNSVQPLNEQNPTPQEQ